MIDLFFRSQLSILSFERLTWMNFGCLHWRYKEHPCPLIHDLGHWKIMDVSDWGWHLDIGLDMVTGLWYTYDLDFSSLSLFQRCKENPCPLSPHLGLWRMLEVPDSGSASWSWFGYDPWSLIHQSSKFWVSNLILNVQRTSIAFISSFGSFEDAGGSWLGFVFLILICIRSLVFDIPMFWILSLYLDFEGAKNIHVL